MNKYSDFYDKMIIITSKQCTILHELVVSRVKFLNKTFKSKNV